MPKSSTQGQIPQSTEFCIFLTLTILGLIAFTWLQYSVPIDFHSIMGINHAGFLFYVHSLGIHPASCSVTMYIGGFRLILIGLVCIHLALCRSALTINPRHINKLFLVVIVVNLLAAVLYPPVQSVDTFNYTALARIYAYYGLNPYTHTSHVLVQHNDSVAPFLQLTFRSMYGPLWTLLSAALAIVLRGPGLFAQILSYKLVEGISMIIAARAAWRYCERRESSYAAAAVLAVGLNPLALLEGPGNGHNDILMMSIALIALDLYDKQKAELASLTAGISAAIKFVPFFVLPWVAIDLLQKKAAPAKWSSVLVVVLVFLPTVLFFIPFWGHGSALGALMQRSQGQREVLLAKSPQPLPRQIPQPTRRATGLLHSEKNVIALYLLLTLILLGRKRLLGVPAIARLVKYVMGESGYPAWLALWIIQATLQRYVIGSYWFSWYYAWSIFPAACVWTKRGNPLLVATMVMALVDTLFYTF